MIAADQSNPNRLAVIHDFDVDGIIDHVPEVGSDNIVNDMLGYYLPLEVGGDVPENFSASIHMSQMKIDQAAALNKGQGIRAHCQDIQVSRRGDKDEAQEMTFDGCSTV